MNRLQKFYQDKSGGANCRSSGHHCQINPKSGRCKAVEGKADHKRCKCVETKSGWRCKNASSDKVKVSQKKDIQKPVYTRSKLDSDSESDNESDNESDSESSAWEKVLEEYRQRHTRIKTHQDRDEAFHRYTELMKQPKKYWAGQAEIKALAEALGISISVIEQDESGDFQVIAQGIMNLVNERPLAVNIPVFYNGNDHYMRFQLDPSSIIEKDRQIVTGQVIDVPGDGDCFYTSLYRGLRTSPSGRMILRRHGITSVADLRHIACQHQLLYRERYMPYFYSEVSDSDSESE